MTTSAPHPSLPACACREATQHRKQATIMMLSSSALWPMRRLPLPLLLPRQLPPRTCGLAPPAAAVIANVCSPRWAMTCQATRLPSHKPPAAAGVMGRVQAVARRHQTPQARGGGCWVPPQAVARLAASGHHRQAVPHHRYHGSHVAVAAMAVHDVPPAGPSPAAAACAAPPQRSQMSRTP